MPFLPLKSMRLWRALCSGENGSLYSTHLTATTLRVSTGEMVSCCPGWQRSASHAPCMWGKALRDRRTGRGVLNVKRVVHAAESLPSGDLQVVEEAFNCLHHDRGAFSPVSRGLHLARSAVTM